MTLNDFPLAWRWTDEKYASFPLGVLSQMQPLAPEVAKRALQESLGIWGSNLPTELTVIPQKITRNEVSQRDIVSWLLAQCREESIRVFISWQPTLALTTTWGIFAEYWDDFCYPASDDVRVWSAQNDWVLEFHHSELMQFSRRGAVRQ